MESKVPSRVITVCNDANGQIECLAVQKWREVTFENQSRQSVRQSRPTVIRHQTSSADGMMAPLPLHPANITS